MRAVKLSAVQDRAERLDQPYMIDEYIAAAKSFDGEVFTFDDETHAELNRHWDESRPAKGFRMVNGPCQNCGGLN